MTSDTTGALSDALDSIHAMGMIAGTILGDGTDHQIDDDYIISRIFELAAKTYFDITCQPLQWERDQYLELEQTWLDKLDN